MKEKIALALCLLSITLAMVASIKPAEAQVEGFAWNNPAFMGHDESYDGDHIVGYLAGTNWNFTLMWENYYGYQINVSAIRIYFGWGKNYTHTYSSPITLKSGTIGVFNVAQATPTLAEAPENFGHGYSYYVYIHHVNRTGGSLDPWIISGPSGDNFVVLSEDHLACLNIWSKYETMFGHPMLTSAQPSLYFMYFTNITGVQINFTQAMMEFYQGMNIFEAGVYDAALVHLQRADTYFSAALSTWATRGTALEDANLAHLNSDTAYNNALADGTRKQADAAMMNSYGWLLFGLGWTFIGIGLIIYGIRKPKGST